MQQTAAKLGMTVCQTLFFPRKSCKEQLPKTMFGHWNGSICNYVFLALVPILPANQ